MTRLLSEAEPPLKHAQDQEVSTVMCLEKEYSITQKQVSRICSDTLKISLHIAWHLLASKEHFANATTISCTSPR